MSKHSSLFGPCPNTVIHAEKNCSASSVIIHFGIISPTLSFTDCKKISITILSCLFEIHQATGKPSPNSWLRWNCIHWYHVYHLYTQFLFFNSCLHLLHCTACWANINTGIFRVYVIPDDHTVFIIVLSSIEGNELRHGNISKHKVCYHSLQLHPLFSYSKVMVYFLQHSQKKLVRILLLIWSPVIQHPFYSEMSV